MKTTTTITGSSDTRKESCCEVLKQLPATPNSCWNSSASSKAVNNERNKTLADEVEDEAMGFFFFYFSHFCFSHLLFLVGLWFC
jgi:hypothetical protein